MKLRLLAGIAAALLAAGALAALSSPPSFEDCVLDGMAGAQADTPYAIDTIKQACRAKRRDSVAVRIERALEPVVSLFADNKPVSRADVTFDDLTPATAPSD